MRSKRAHLKEYWLENCNTCENMIKTHYLHDGKDDGYVSYKCKISMASVTPQEIDGCKKYSNGENVNEYKEVAHGDAENKD